VAPRRGRAELGEDAADACWSVAYLASIIVSVGLTLEIARDGVKVLPRAADALMDRPPKVTGGRTRLPTAWREPWRMRRVRGRPRAIARTRARDRGEAHGARRECDELREHIESSRVALSSLDWRRHEVLVERVSRVD
jgi:hypothetical protein